MGRERFTLDTLAAMIVTEFVAVREEIGALRQEVRAGFGRIERKLDNTVERVDDHEVRLVRLERRRRH
jgi:hypothetical protein